MSPTSSGRPRLLFLAYFFPPAREIASVRSDGMARSLARLGWDVTVVTPDANVWRRADEDGQSDRSFAADGVRCLRTRHPWRFLAPRYTVPSFERAGWLTRRVGGRLAAWTRRIARVLGVPTEIGWIHEAEREAACLASGSIDLILVSGSPFAAFAAARRLAKRLHCGYVLDYRDLWSGNPYTGHRLRPGTLLQEQRLLDDCAAAIAVSPGMAQALQERFEVGSKLHVLPNGFDSDELADITPHEFGHFAIVYTGRFYPPRSVVTPLIAAIAMLDARGNTAANGWAFHYFGRHGEHVREQAKSFGVERRVVIHGEVSRPEALRAVKGAGMAVVVTSVASDGSIEERGVVTGKVFEALGLGTPVLAIAPPQSDLEDIFRVAGLGRRFSASEVFQMVAYLEDAIRGRVPPSRDREAFAWSRLGHRLDGLLRAALRREEAAPSRRTSGDSFEGSGLIS